MIGRGSAGVRLFNVADDEHIVSAVRLDEEEASDDEVDEVEGGDAVPESAPDGIEGGDA